MSQGDRLPWFPLYVYLYETSQRVKAMSLEAEGAYNALLRSQWINGNVPASDEGLRGVLVKPCSQEALEQVKPCFPVASSDPSIRFNQRLEEIRVEQARKVQAASTSGRKGGIASGLARRRLASSEREATLKQASSTRVSISSSSSSVVEAGTPEGTEERPQPGKALVRTGKNELAVQKKTVDRKTKEAALNLGAEVVFRYWRDRMGFDPQRTILNEKRRKRIIDRLRENGGDVSELLYVVDGGLRDDWTMGRDARSTKPYNGTQTIFRDREKVEALLALVKRREDQHPYLSEPQDD